jgi:hypothetical protein
MKVRAISSHAANSADPTAWAAPGPPCGQRRRYTPRCQQWVRTPSGKCRTPGCTYRTSGRGSGPPQVQTRPLGRVSDPSRGGSGPLTVGSPDSKAKNTQALCKARRGSGADTCRDHIACAPTPGSGGDPMLPRGLLHVT